MSLDLTTLAEPPDFSTVAILTIHALAPLSMVARMPGKYFRSQPIPTDDMLYGLLENALGWHIAEIERSKLVESLQKRHQTKAKQSGARFSSLLQYHLRFGIPMLPPLPTMMHYDDYWSQHLQGPRFPTGSREYGYQAIPIKNEMAHTASLPNSAPDTEKIKVNDRKEALRSSNLISEFQKGQTIHLDVLVPFFPRYYISPTPREYVVPNGPYKYRVETSAELAKQIATAINDPAAPLYLGSNDGWVEVEWRVMS